MLGLSRRQQVRGNDNIFGPLSTLFNLDKTPVNISSALLSNLQTFFSPIAIAHDGVQLIYGVITLYEVQLYLVAPRGTSYLRYNHPSFLQKSPQSEHNSTNSAFIECTKYICSRENVDHGSFSTGLAFPCHPPSPQCSSQKLGPLFVPSWVLSMCDRLLRFFRALLPLR